MAIKPNGRLVLRILAQDVEEYLAPIYSSGAQLVICILGPDYPKRVWTKFESEQFKNRFKSGDVIPIVMSTAPLGVFDTAAKVGYIAWDRAGDFQSTVAKSAEVLKRKSVEVRARIRRDVEKALAAQVEEQQNDN